MTSYSLLAPFNKADNILWQIRNRWNNCKNMVKALNIICTHIPREGNQVADAWAKNGHGLPSFTTQWWNDPPLFLEVLLLRDSTGLPFSRPSSL